METIGIFLSSVCLAVLGCNLLDVGTCKINITQKIVNAFFLFLAGKAMMMMSTFVQ